MMSAGRLMGGGVATHRPLVPGTGRGHVRVHEQVDGRGHAHRHEHVHGNVARWGSRGWELRQDGGPRSVVGNQTSGWGLPAAQEVLVLHFQGHERTDAYRVALSVARWVRGPPASPRETPPSGTRSAGRRRAWQEDSGAWCAQQGAVELLGLLRLLANNLLQRLRKRHLPDRDGHGRRRSPTPWAELFAWVRPALLEPWGLSPPSQPLSLGQPDTG